MEIDYEILRRLENEESKEYKEAKELYGQEADENQISITAIAQFKYF